MSCWTKTFCPRSGNELPSLFARRHTVDVRGILIFLHERDDPGLPQGIAYADPPFMAVYLNRFLPTLLTCEPENPFVAVLAPLVIERDDELKAQVPKRWQAIQSANLPKPKRTQF